MAIVEFQERSDAQQPSDPNAKKKLIYDEFHQIRMTRYNTPMESFMEIWGEPIVRKSHIVNFIFFSSILFVSDLILLFLGERT